MGGEFLAIHTHCIYGTLTNRNKFLHKREVRYPTASKKVPGERKLVSFSQTQCTHTHTHTKVHAHTHTHTQVHTHTHGHTHAYTHTQYKM